MKETHDHGSTDEECDWDILRRANDKGKFAIELGQVMCDHLQAAFERGINNSWWTMVDLSFIAEYPSRSPMRIFKLTTFGESRRAQLEKKFSKAPTH